MSAPQSSASDLAWAPMPRHISHLEADLTRRAVTRCARDEAEAAEFLAALGLEVAS